MDIQRLAKQNKLNRRLVRKTQDGTLGKPTEEPEDEEDDTVHIGDVTILQPASNQPTYSQINGVQDAGQKSNRLATAALLVATLLGGAGIGAAALHYAATPAVSPHPATSAATAADVDTQWTLRLVEDGATPQ
jgi:hypothetical protein